jgi:hypothetical protein
MDVIGMRGDIWKENAWRGDDDDDDANAAVRMAARERLDDDDGIAIY